MRNQELLERLEEAYNKAGSIPYGTLVYHSQWVPFVNLYNAAERVIDDIERPGTEYGYELYDVSGMVVLTTGFPYETYSEADRRGAVRAEEENELHEEVPLECPKVGHRVVSRMKAGEWAQCSV